MSLRNSETLFLPPSAFCTPLYCSTFALASLGFCYKTEKRVQAKKISLIFCGHLPVTPNLPTFYRFLPIICIYIYIYMYILLVVPFSHYGPSSQQMLEQSGAKVHELASIHKRKKIAWHNTRDTGRVWLPALAVFLLE